MPAGFQNCQDRVSSFFLVPRYLCLGIGGQRNQQEGRVISSSFLQVGIASVEQTSESIAEVTKKLVKDKDLSLEQILCFAY